MLRRLGYGERSEKGKEVRNPTIAERKIIVKRQFPGRISKILQTNS